MTMLKRLDSDKCQLSIRKCKYVPSTFFQLYGGETLYFPVVG